MASWTRAVGTLAMATVRSGWKGPAPWVATGAGLLLLWAGISLDVLAVSGRTRALEIGVGTAESVAALVAVWMVVRSMDVDRSGGLGSAMDASALGPSGRLLGRWKGAVLTAAMSGLTIGAASAIFDCIEHSYANMYLYVAFIVPAIQEAALAASWALLAARWLQPVGAVLFGLATFVAGRALPSGAPGFALALLPVPVEPRAPFASPAALVAEVVACGGLLLLALARRPAPQVD